MKIISSRCAKFPISDNFCCLVEGRLKTLRVPFSGREHRRTNFVGSFRRHTDKKKASLVASARPRKPEQCLEMMLYTLVCHGTALESTLASIMLIDFSFAFSSLQGISSAQINGFVTRAVYGLACQSCFSYVHQPHGSRQYVSPAAGLE